MDNQSLGIATFFLVINLVAFCMMLLDKNKAKKVGIERISEGLMFFMATAFGSLGVYLGMFVFHHKTRKWYFIIGIPMLVIQNVSFLYLLYKML